MVRSRVMMLPVLFALSIHTVFLYTMCVLFDCRRNAGHHWRPVVSVPLLLMNMSAPKRATQQ